MNLAIFDVDGTLTQTDHVDDICFVQAMSDAYSIENVSTDWSGYPHTTDAAIMSHLFQQEFNRQPNHADVTKFRSCLVGLLNAHRTKDASLFAEINGATSMLRRLNNEPNWKVAIASGAWRASAMLKLEAAGIEVDGLPAAFSDDGFSREEILRTAVSNARIRYMQDDFERIVSIGDGVWDVRTARNLGFPFVGIGSEAREMKLSAEGATHVIKDYANYELLMRCLECAGVPATS